MAEVKQFVMFDYIIFLMDDKKIFSNKLNELMKQANISSLALSKIIGVRDTTVLRWRNGDRLPTVDKLRNLCQYFDVSADYLLGLED